MSSAVKSLFLKKRNADSAPNREFRPLSAPRPLFAREKRDSKPRYRVDLSGQQADCEANYLRLKKILPDFSERDEWLFHIGADERAGQLLVQVVDRAPYTTTLELSQPADGVASSLKAPRLRVCMYHDADMAEVTAWEGHRRFKPRYDYPNPGMYQSNEKEQLNRFLAEWLSHCQAEGRLVFDLADLGFYK
ncbi:DUF1249 domain-containing protein [Gilvimarinus sp. F26214L]|uniref:DUF1249 domain-containing protein n=1 Tax=Gilvimarinus sp. DZF01 TaxID=3461371 RepID=UPI0040464239